MAEMTSNQSRRGRKEVAGARASAIWRNTLWRNISGEASAAQAFGEQEAG